MSPDDLDRPAGNGGPSAPGPETSVDVARPSPPPEPTEPATSEQPAPRAVEAVDAARPSPSPEPTEPATSEQPAPRAVEAEPSANDVTAWPSAAETPEAPDAAGAVGAADENADEEVDDDGRAPKKKRRRRKRKRKKPGTGPDAAAGAKPQPKPKPATDRAPFHVGEEVFGKVTAVLPTAIMVDLSGKALAIFDRTEMEPDDLVPEVGDRFLARVHNDGARGGFVVLTRKPLREEEAKPWVEQAAKLGLLCPGLITGVIKGGVEVDIGGLRAFAPASGMDLHPSEANFTALIGQRPDFKVVEYENNGRDVVVTRRPMLEAEAHKRRKKALKLLEEGQVKAGVVRTVVEWGAFVALPEAENLEGLVHISEASHDQHAKMTDLMNPGDQIEVKITKIDERGKIWLSRKALIEDPWAEARKKFAPRSQHTGKVLRLEKFGAFVELEKGIEGLVQVADLSFKRLDHPNEILEEGQDLEVVVSHFDPRNKKIALHPAPPPEQAGEQPQKVQKGSKLKVEIVRGEQSGVVVRILGATGRAARGFIPAGHTGTQRGTDLRKKFKPGATMDVKVLDVDPRRGEPKLSIRALEQDEERSAHREYRKKLKAESGFGTIGDLLAQMKKN